MKHILRLTIAIVVLLLMGTAMTEAGRHKRPGGHEPGGVKKAPHTLLPGKTVKSRAVRSTTDNSFLDPSFGTGGCAITSISGGSGYYDWGSSAAIQSDGKIVVAGVSQDLSGNLAFALARYDTDGSIDNTFGTNGSIRTFINGGNATDDEAYSMAIQLDGKIVAAGYSADAANFPAFALARFNSDGSIDSAFGTSGSVRTFINGGYATNDEAMSVAIQSDGKIVAVGFSEDVSGNYAFALARFNTDGSIDSAFGTSGSVRTFINGGYAANDGAYSLAIRSDGKMVAAGSSGDASNNNDAFALVRLDTDGSIDNTFGTSGSVRIFVNGGDSTNDAAYSLAIQSDGKIVAAGYSGDASGNSAFAVARFDTNGSIDSTFGTSGSTRAFIGGGDSTNDCAYSMAIQSDSRIVTAGFSHDASDDYAFALARFNVDGSIDSTFGISGSARTFINGGDSTYDNANEVAIQSDGRIVAAGYSQIASGEYAFAVARFLPSLLPLPIELASFTATVVNGSNVKLDWTTVSETNNYGFYVERRPKIGTTFTTVSGLIPGAGTSLAEHHYEWTDKNVGPTTYVYRIKQMDLTSHVAYSHEITVTGVLSVNDEAAPRIFQLLQNYPNPFNPSSVIKFSVEKQEHATLRIYDMLGREVSLLFDGMAEPGHYYKFNFDGSQLGSGMYFYRIITDSHSAVRKMLMLK